MTNARILIVEDEAITVSALKRELVSLGYKVAATASTADEALRTVELHKPDLVLMDITLAGTVNGIVGAVAIRGNFVCRSSFSPRMLMTERWSARWLSAPLVMCSSHLAERD